MPVRLELHEGYHPDLLIGFDYRRKRCVYVSMDLMLPGYLHSNRMVAADDRSTQVASMMHAYHVASLSPLMHAAMPAAEAVYGNGSDWCGRMATAAAAAAADSQEFARRSAAAIFRQAYHPSSAYEEERQRKLKSRDAARTRRTNENQEFNELTRLLPIPAAITGQLDKASVIRLTIGYLRLRGFCRELSLPPTNNIPPNPKVKHRLPEEDFEVNHGAHLLQALDGFAFALSADARFLYVSETVSVYLGLSQADMIGRRIFDYTHEQDHMELAEQLDLTPPPSSLSKHQDSLCKSNRNMTSTHDDVRTASLTRQSSSMRIDAKTRQADGDALYDGDTNRCFCIRFKSNLTRRGTHQKCIGFKVVQIAAKLKRIEPEPDTVQQPQQQQQPHLMGVHGLVLPLPSPSINELFVDSDMFITRLTIDLTITFCEARISLITNLSSEDLVNRNLYHMCHALDGRTLRRAHNDLLRKGQAVTDYYRLLSNSAAGGSYVWIQTCATVIHSEKNKDEQSVVAMNYVLGSVKNSSCAFVIHKVDVDRRISETEHHEDLCREEIDHHSSSNADFKIDERTVEDGDEASYRSAISTKRSIDEEDESIEMVLTNTSTSTSALNNEDNKIPTVINSSASCSCPGTTTRRKLMDLRGDEDISHQDIGIPRSTSSDGSDQFNGEIRSGSTDSKDVVMHKVYRPWKRMRHVEQVQQESRE